MSNFIPHETIKVKPRDPPWINKTIKTMLNKQNRIYKNYKKHGYNHTDKIILDEFREKCRLEIERSKERYMLKAL